MASETGGTVENRGALLFAIALLVLAGGYYVHGLAAHGIYYDEHWQRLHGMALLKWYSSGFSDTTVLEQGNLYLYGGLVEATLEAVAGAVPVDPYVVRHALVACLALAAAWGTFVLGSRLAGDRVGLLAMGLLLLSPRFTGHGFFNSKDIPVATFYVWTLVLNARDLRRPIGAPLHRVLPGAVVLGLLLGTRIGAGILLPCIAFGYLLRWRGADRSRSTFVLMAARFSTTFLVAWGVMLVGWPWALRRPFLHPLAALLASSRFPWPYAELFQGRFVSNLDLPMSYVPVWLWRTLPEITLSGLLLALMAASSWAVRHRKIPSPAVVTVVLAGILPLGYVVLTRAAIYDGVRHLLFLQPLLALGGAWGIAQLLDATSRRHRALSGAVLVLLVVGVYPPLREMRLMAPYEYVYFNRVSGGIQGAAGRFELDYWGLSYREGVETLEKITPAGARLASCSHPGSTEPFARRHFEYLGSLKFGIQGEPDYVIYTAPHDCGGTRPYGKGTPLVVREGVPLLYLSPMGHAQPVG